MEANNGAAGPAVNAPTVIVDDEIPTDITPAPPAPPSPSQPNWEALGLQNNEMEQFAAFISDNLQVVLDAAQGVNLRILQSLNCRLKQLEKAIADEKDEKTRIKFARDYRETAALALKAANQVTTSGYTRIKAAAKAVDAGNKLKRKPGFVKNAEKV